MGLFDFFSRFRRKATVAHSSGLSENDDKPVQAQDSIDKLVQDQNSFDHEESCSSLQCICGSHQSCCRKHKSLRTPNTPERPSPFRRAVGSISNDSRSLSKEDTDLESETLCDVSEVEAEGLSSDLQSALTLAPIHFAVSYHLSLDNLRCIRSRLASTAKTIFIKELFCEGEATSTRDVNYDWSNEIYFTKGTFLQKQEIICYIDDKRAPTQHFFCCPHQSLSISSPSFNNKGELFEVQAWVTNQPRRCAAHAKERWSSSQGRHAQVAVCMICHSNAECVLQLYDTSLLVRYTCYRDLGPGTDLNHPKWHSLLTGEGTPHRQKYGLELYARVWRTADRLCRPGLEDVTHQTPDGAFHVDSR
jgi:hypothetical protein